MFRMIKVTKKSDLQSLLIFGSLFLGLICSLLWLYQAIFLPLVVGIILSYLLYPIVEWVDARLDLSRRLIVFTTVVVCLGLITLVLVFFAPPLYQQVGDLIDLAPAAYHRFLGRWLPMLKNMVVEYKVMSGDQFEEIYSNVTVGSELFEAFKNTLATVWRTAPKIFGTVLSVFLVPLVTYVSLQHYHRINSYFYSLVPRRSIVATKAIVFRLNETLRAVIKGQVYVASTLGLMYVVGFSIAGLKAGAAIGIVCGVARLVPYLDIVVGIFLSFIVFASSFSGWSVVIGVGLVILIVQLLDGMIVTPQLIGGKVGLHPAIVICSVVAFSGLMGFWGVLIAIPAVALLKESTTIFIEYYRGSQFYRS